MLTIQVADTLIGRSVSSDLVYTISQLSIALEQYYLLAGSDFLSLFPQFGSAASNPLGQRIACKLKHFAPQQHAAILPEAVVCLYSSNSRRQVDGIVGRIVGIVPLPCCVGKGKIGSCSVGSVSVNAIPVAAHS